jgi:hypothetical protein
MSENALVGPANLQVVMNEEHGLLALSFDLPNLGRAVFPLDADAVKFLLNTLSECAETLAKNRVKHGCDA